MGRIWAFRSVAVAAALSGVVIGGATRASAGALEDAIEAVVADQANPKGARRWLLHNLRYAPVDYAPTLDTAGWESVLRDLLPAPPSFGSNLFNTTSGRVWIGDGLQDVPGQAAPASLTYSFPRADLAWGFSGQPSGANDLPTWLCRVHGAQNLDYGLELIRQAMGGWSRDAGLTFTQVGDDGSAMSTSSTRLATRGDLRIGGAYRSESSTVAYNGFPNTHEDFGFLILGGGDTFLNTAFFDSDATIGHFSMTADDFGRFRGVVTHEVGHGLGFHHVFPGSGAFIMETGSTSAGVFVRQTPGIDDLRNAGRNYGDVLAPNHDLASAVDLGALSAGDSLAIPNLSTNGFDGVNNTFNDSLTFTLGSSATVQITVTPTGGAYNTTDPQNQNPSFVDAEGAGDLRIVVTSQPGGTPFVVDTGTHGVTEVYNALLGAGDYLVEIEDVGPNAAVNQIVQMYDLRVDVAGGSGAPPTAFIGVDKRVAADTHCFFFGDLLSRTNEPGASIVQYDWDLDGDSVFETLNDPRPMTTYSATGVLPVTLRVTDSNGRTDEHSINVDVIATPLFLALTELDTGVLMRGRSANVTLHGWRLDELTSASEVIVDPGIQVSVSGTPMGTFETATGIVFSAASNATLGKHDVFVSVGAEFSAAVLDLEIVAFADLSGDGSIDGADLAALLASWGPCPVACLADLDDDGMVGGSDLAALLAAWSP